MNQISFREIAEEYNNMNLYEKVSALFFLLVLIGTLFAMILESGPVVPITNFMNYYQAFILQKIFGGELMYYGKLTIIIISLLAAVPFIIAKKMKNRTNKITLD